jgi:cyclopropane fatty-acyl-phospholipid synthase-like methyltransferase
MADLDDYYNFVISNRLFSSRTRLSHKVATVFGRLDLRHKRLLDIGGGWGIYSFYAACAGASAVVCLEPEFDGSTRGVADTFQQVNTSLGNGAVVLERQSIQNYAPPDGGFDVILLHNSVNHIDEEACRRLASSSEARRKYNEVFAMLYRITNPQGEVIICDCSSHNVFAALGIRNPMMPSIDWDLHHPRNCG